MEQENEKAVIQRVQQGDTEAFSYLVEGYKKPVFNLAYRLLGNAADADEAAQETFVKAYMGISGFDLQRSFFPWLYSICLNVVRKKARSRKVRRALKQTLFWEKSYKLENNEAEQDLLAEEEKQKLEQALSLIELKYREAVVLRFIEELPYADMAKVLNISQSAAKMRVYRGLEKLKKRMQT